MNMCNITFDVSRLSTFVFKKSSEKKIFMIISQRVDQHYFTIGPMYRVIRVVAFRGIKRHPYDIQSKHGQSPKSVSLLGQRRIRLGTGIGWVGLHCVYQVHRIDLSAMVVEGICLHVEDIRVSLVFSMIISWIFRTPAHERKNNTAMFTKYQAIFFVWNTQTDQSRASEFGNSFSSFW